MTKTDFKKVMPAYKAKQHQFAVVEVPTMQYLMIDGDSGPASPDFGKAVETLYPVAYKLKFLSKLELNQDYVVPPLEGLWWAHDMSAFTTNFDQSEWLWAVMLMTPDWITQDMVNAVCDEVASKKNPPSLDKLRLQSLAEGLCVQTLHRGPFADEGPVLAKMHDEFIPENGLAMTGKHHEIYFSDPRKSAPEKLRTILRQPVERVT